MRDGKIPCPWPDFGSILDRFLASWNKVLEFGRIKPPTRRQLPLHDGRSRTFVVKAIIPRRRNLRTTETVTSSQAPSSCSNSVVVYIMYRSAPYCIRSAHCSPMNTVHTYQYKPSLYSPAPSGQVHIPLGGSTHQARSQHRQRTPRPRHRAGRAGAYASARSAANSPGASRSGACWTRPCSLAGWVRQTPVLDRRTFAISPGPCSETYVTGLMRSASVLACRYIISAGVCGVGYTIGDIRSPCRMNGPGGQISAAAAHFH